MNYAEPPALYLALVLATLAVAVADWWAVGTGNRRAEYVLKPAVMVVLIAAALAAGDTEPAAARWWVLGALVFSLAGDVFLMLEGRFVEGLGSFLVGHLAYIGAFVAVIAADGLNGAALALGAVLVAVAAPLLGTRVVRGAGAHDRALRLPVAAYITVITAMVLASFAAGRPLAIVGALLFYVSDALIGWSRFVGELPNQRLLIITTYHLGQLALVLGLLRIP